MTTIVEDAEQVAKTLTDAGVRAYVDPARAATNRPCVLVAPPSLDFTERSISWRLFALSGTDAPSVQALKDLDKLVTGVVAHNIRPIEAAEAASYPLIPERAPVPAYLLRFTTTIEE